VVESFRSAMGKALPAAGSGYGHALLAEHRLPVLYCSRSMLYRQQQQCVTACTDTDSHVRGRGGGSSIEEWENKVKPLTAKSRCAWHATATADRTDSSRELIQFARIVCVQIVRHNRSVENRCWGCVQCECRATDPVRRGRAGAPQRQNTYIPYRDGQSTHGILLVSLSSVGNHRGPREMNRGVIAAPLFSQEWTGCAVWCRRSDLHERRQCAPPPQPTTHRPQLNALRTACHACAAHDMRLCSAAPAGTRGVGGDACGECVPTHTSPTQRVPTQCAT
jgi:hypothetical protein